MKNKILSLLFFVSIAYSAEEAFPDYSLILPKIGFTNILKVDPTLKLEIRYATTNNFMHRNLYGSFTNCYLRTEVAAMLAKAQTALREKYPRHSLKVFDGFRPRRIQFAMWALVSGTSQETYVANPNPGSVHNFGAAVDLTIVDEQGKELDMGTPYDFFGPLAEPRLQDDFLKKGLLRADQISNRNLLKTAMISGGFQPILYEWWHFDGIDIGELKKNYRPID